MTDHRNAARIWRIMSWNIHGAAHPDLDAVARVVDRLRPDVVSLQEVRRGQARDLGRILGWHRRWARKHAPATPLLPHLDEGLAILSPHTLTDVRRTVVSHREPIWSWRRRIALGATVLDGTDAVRLVDVHLAAHHAVDARIEQARRLCRAARLLDRPPGTALVVAGDLNTHGEPEVIREFHPLGLVDPGGHATCPSTAPQHRLDRVLVPAGSTTVDVLGDLDRRIGDDEANDWLTVDWATLSDHLPVVVDVEIHR